MTIFFQTAHKESVSRLHKQIGDAKTVIEELEATSALQIAEAKQQMHSMLEQKDGELAELRKSLTEGKQESEGLADRLAEVEKKGKKSRN